MSARRFMLLLVLVAVAAAARAGETIASANPPFTLRVPEGFHARPGAGGILFQIEEVAAPPAPAPATATAARPIAITIERLGGLLERPLPDGEARREQIGEGLASLRSIAADPGLRVDVQPLVWRGATVDEITTRTRGTAVFSVRLPLAVEGIQMNVGGPEAREAEVHATLVAALAGLDARVRWADEARRDQAIATGLLAGGIVLLASIAFVVSRRRAAARRAAEPAA